MSYLDDQKQKGLIRSAAVYFQGPNSGQWFPHQRRRKVIVRSYHETDQPWNIYGNKARDRIWPVEQTNPAEATFSELPETLFSKPWKPEELFGTPTAGVHDHSLKQRRHCSANREVEPGSISIIVLHCNSRVPGHEGLGLSGQMYSR